MTGCWWVSWPTALDVAPMRGCNRPKLGRPRSSSATISPSRMALEPESAGETSASSGYCFSMRRPVRDSNLTWPSAQKSFSVQAEFHVAAVHLLGKRFFTQQLVAAPIPHADAAGAVIAFRYRALKVAVLQRMIFHQHGQTFFCRIERGTLGDCPGFQ